MATNTNALFFYPGPDATLQPRKWLEFRAAALASGIFVLFVIPSEARDLLSCPMETEKQTTCMRI
jgi:hypothetical protein